VAKDFVVPENPLFRRAIETAESPTELWANLKTVAEQQRAQAAAEEAGATPPPTPAIPSIQPPPNLVSRPI
jgi:hypothetical protein